jgi:hypothetical protein
MVESHRPPPGFDTYAAFKRLVQAGFTEQQAEGLVLVLLDWTAALRQEGLMPRRPRPADSAVVLWDDPETGQTP